ncbi:MAG: hypothetical protein ABS98_00475 [Lysobacteraceae bacterium SCN 69-48]|nr:MAG: hypothetical protein ABS98_00475 [Xanthomonadaceae bacterium SCN 69-48]
MKSLLLAILLVAGASHAQSADQAIADAKAAIAMKMKDPESARFAGVVASPKGGTVCGWVNAKNSYGGYVGYKPFYVMGRFADVRDGDDVALSNRGSFAMMWRACGLVPEGESFGDALVKLPKVDIAKQCAKNRKTADGPELYANCETREAEAQAWLQSHATGSFIAFKCEQDIRRYSSYAMGKSCVESREVHMLIDRGPPVVAGAGS